MATDDGKAPRTCIHGSLTEGAPAADTERARRLSEEILERRQAGGRYVLQSHLASGGMGIVSLVWDQDLQRGSAMKIVKPELTKEPHRLRAFVAEGRITAQLEHPNIVPVHEIGIVEETGCPFYTMKKIEGEALAEIIAHLLEGDDEYRSKYNRRQLLDIFLRVCDAVAYAHSRGVMHRDIKPENIMVGQFGEVLLMDWGLAKYVGRGDDDTALSTEMLDSARQTFETTADGIIKGSLAYMSPEQAFGDVGAVDERTDVFLLGATLYHMFTYHPPYGGGSVQEVLSKAERGDYVPPTQTQHGAELPMAVERIILRAMAPLPNLRYQSVLALMQDIRAVQMGRRSAGRRVFGRGETLMQAGEVGLDSYVIVSGQVEVSRAMDDKVIPIARLGPGEIVGEMAGITRKTRSATVTALETTETLVISHDLMLEELDNLPPWMAKIVLSLADRVRILDEHVHPLMLKSRAFPVVNQLHYIFANAYLNRKSPKDTICFPRKALLDEISGSLGIDRHSCDEVMDALQEVGLCIVDMHGRVYIPRLRDFALFVDYCRYKFGIRGGIKEIRQIRIDPDLETFFKKAVRELRRIGQKIAKGKGESGDEGDEGDE